MRHWRSSGNGSRPKYQWCLQTRSKAWSQAPCTKQWLQCGHHPRLIPIRRVLFRARLGRLPERTKIAMSQPQQQSPATIPQPGPPIAHRKRAREQKSVEPAVFQPHAAGIDIGAREIYVAIPADRDEHPVRRCGTFTGDLHQMAEWLVHCGITTAAMESTGVYWIPVYDVLEQHGIQVCLVNPRNMKNVPGKRTDFHECQWIQHMHRS